MVTEAWLMLAAFVTGILNTAGGGGAIVTFLALTASGVAPLTAHSTSQLVTPVSYLTAAPLATVYRPGLPLMVTGCLGTTAGAAILTVTPPMAFAAVAPYVLVIAALVVVAQDRVRRSLRLAGRSLSPWVRLVSIFVCGVYAGLIGVGTGTVALAVLGLTTRWDELRALLLTRNVLLLGVAIVVGLTFALTGLADWRLAALLAVPGLIGGWIGTTLVDRLPTPALRVLVIATAIGGALWMVFR